MHPPTAPELDRFFAKVVLPPDPDDCWEWIGATAGGYGTFVHGGNKRTVRAHRLIYQWFWGTLPAGSARAGLPSDHLVVDHLCNRPTCVNPTHLQIISQRENILRGAGPPARNARRTHCIHGHDLSDAYIQRDGHRLCRLCHSRRVREYRLRKG